jgi:hypothetical protein
MDMVEPRFKKSNTEMSLPSCVCPQVLSVEPSCANERNENVDPSLMESKIEYDEDNVQVPKHDNFSPINVEPRIDSVLARFICDITDKFDDNRDKPSSDKFEFNFANDLRDSVEPMVNLSRMDMTAFSPSVLPVPHIEMLDPNRDAARSEIAEPRDIASKTDREDWRSVESSPRVNLPSVEQVDPRRPKCRSDSVEPNETASRIDSWSLTVTFSKTDSSEPRRVK